MSRIGKAPIAVPEKVQVNVDASSNKVTVKGPLGELSQAIDPDIKVAIENGEIKVTRPTDHKRHRSLHGLYRALINNMVLGVTQGFTLKLELVGVGFRASNVGQRLEIAVGYSHPILFIIPKEVKVTTEQVKGQNPFVTLQSTDKQLLGQVAAKIRAFRKPEPYKGKGIKFEGETLRRKEGKKAGK